MDSIETITAKYFDAVEKHDIKSLFRYHIDYPEYANTLKHSALTRTDDADTVLFLLQTGADPSETKFKCVRNFLLADDLNMADHIYINRSVNPTVTIWHIIITESLLTDAVAEYEFACKHTLLCDTSDIWFERAVQKDAYGIASFILESHSGFRGVEITVSNTNTSWWISQLEPQITRIYAQVSATERVEFLAFSSKENREFCAQLVAQFPLNDREIELLRLRKDKIGIDFYREIVDNFLARFEMTCSSEEIYDISVANFVNLRDLNAKKITREIYFSRAAEKCAENEAFYIFKNVEFRENEAIFAQKIAHFLRGDEKIREVFDLLSQNIPLCDLMCETFWKNNACMVKLRESDSVILQRKNANLFATTFDHALLRRLFARFFYTQAEIFTLYASATSVFVSNLDEKNKQSETLRLLLNQFGAISRDELREILVKTMLTGDEITTKFVAEMADNDDKIACIKRVADKDEFVQICDILRDLLRELPRDTILELSKQYLKTNIIAKKIHAAIFWYVEIEKIEENNGEFGLFNAFKTLILRIKFLKNNTLKRLAIRAVRKLPRQLCRKYLPNNLYYATF